MSNVNTSNILGALSGMTVASAESRKANEQIPMTPEYEKQLAAKLKAENRMGVYPNRFNMKLPYRVQISHGRNPEDPSRQMWHQQGYFTNLEVATAIGTIAGKAFFGEKAIAGVFDAAEVENHPEFVRWCNDERNADVIARAQVA